ncbi:hypothetical protein EV363DRAFT_1419965 [Boletus edulis]|nr:hypothetical protein EV363DRAFT_1419965 [Boletus edulis]
MPIHMRPLDFRRTLDDLMRVNDVQNSPSSYVSIRLHRVMRLKLVFFFEADWIEYKLLSGGACVFPRCHDLESPEIPAIEFSEVATWPRVRDISTWTTARESKVAIIGVHVLNMTGLISIMNMSWLKDWMSALARSFPPSPSVARAFLRGRDACLGVVSAKLG